MLVAPIDPPPIWLPIHPMLVGMKGLPRVTWISLGLCDGGGFVVSHVKPLEWICNGLQPNGMVVWDFPHLGIIMWE
jgi:hypothetical protein